jgi:hypothetical protein
MSIHEQSLIIKPTRVFQKPVATGYARRRKLRMPSIRRWCGLHGSKQNVSKPTFTVNVDFIRFFKVNVNVR